MKPKALTEGKKTAFSLDAVTICIQYVLCVIDVELQTLIHQFHYVRKFFLLNLSTSIKANIVCCYVFYGTIKLIVFTLFLLNVTFNIEVFQQT